MSSSVAAEHPLQLAERPAGHQHLLALAEHVVPGRSRTASRYESVATSRSPSSSAAISTPVRIGRASSVLAARTTWRSASANAGAGSVTALGRRLGQRGIVVERRAAAPRTANGRRVMRDLVVVDRRPRPRPARSDAHDVGDEPGRHDDRRRRARRRPATVEPDRQLEVGAGDGELVAGQLEAHPGQHRERAGAARRRPAGGGQRLGEDVTLASELHSAAFPTSR